MATRRHAQGQSELATEAKERGFSAALAINFTVFQSITNVPHASYQHFDLNAGCGMNDKVGVIGSPLVFQYEAIARGLRRYDAYFCDHSIDAITELSGRIMPTATGRMHVIHADNAEFCEHIPRLIHESGEREKYALGSIFIDPNGASIPIDAVANVARLCPRLDVFICLAATALKRAAGYQVPSILDILHKIPKHHWLIRTPIGKWQWTMLLGRNFAVGEHRALGFYDLNSEPGREILAKCHLTNAALNAELTVAHTAKQPSLF